MRGRRDARWFEFRAAVDAAQRALLELPLAGDYVSRLENADCKKKPHAEGWNRFDDRSKIDGLRTTLAGDRSAGAPALP